MKRLYTDYGEENNKNLWLVIGLVRSLNGQDRGLQHLLSSFHLTVPQFGVLEVLYHRGDLKICEIIEKTLSTSGNMTVVIKNLEKESLIVREKSEEDKRASMICLTEKGRMLIEEIFPKHLEMLTKIFSRLDGKEKNELICLIKKMNGIE